MAQGRRGKGWGHTHVTGQTLVVLHQVLILLVDSQDLADAVGSRLRLAQGGTQAHQGCPEQAALPSQDAAWTRLPAAPPERER